MRQHEVIIIGAGPVGIEMAVELKKRRIDFAVIEAGCIGSTMNWWAPGTKFFSSPERIQIAGVPLTTADQDKATREEYLCYLRTVIGTFEVPITSYTRVVSAKASGDGFELTTCRSYHGVGGPTEQVEARDGRQMGERLDEQVWRAQKIIMAIGDMHQPRLLHVPGESLPNVSHFFDDPHIYFPGRVLIVGGKNSAVEAAIRCYRAGCDVTVSYRGPRFDKDRIKYWLLPEIEWLIKKGRIGFLPGTRPIEFRAAGAVLERVEGVHGGYDVEQADLHEVQLEQGEGFPEGAMETTEGRLRAEDMPVGEPMLFPADHVLLLTGYVQDPDLFTQLGVELVGETRKPRFDLATMETNVPGVYVAGTSTGGSQIRTKVFIETSHVHVQRIAEAVCGRRFEGDQPTFEELEES